MCVCARGLSPVGLLSALLPKSSVVMTVIVAVAVAVACC